MKRSVNFRGNKATVTRKALGARSLLATMKFVGMTEEEQRSFLHRATCTCGPNDGCHVCSSRLRPNKDSTP